MKPDYDALQRRLEAGEQQQAGSSSYVQLATRLFLGASQVSASEAVPMDGYNTLLVDCTAFVANGTGDPLVAIYVQVGNQPNLFWTSMPIGAPIPLDIIGPGYYQLDPSDIGQISAAYVRLYYVADSATTAAILSVGLNRKRVGGNGTDRNGRRPNMYRELASRLFISASSSEVTEAVDMEGYNAVCIDVTLFTGSVLTVTLESSNLPATGWTPVTGSATVPASGSGPTAKLVPDTTFTLIAAKFVRVKIATNATAAIVAVGINCTNIGA